MKDQLIPGSPIDPADIAELECVRTGMLTMGKFTELFEHEFAATVGAKHAVMVNSGSSANLLALSVLKTLVPSIRTVGVPAVTWSTTLAPVVQLGLTPVLLDVSTATLVVDKQLPPVDALMNVHLLGQLSPATAPYVIEDCCEALGTRNDGMHVGTQDDMGTFSFYFAHHLTTIEGGMVVTNNDDYYEELLMQRAHGWIRDLPESRQQYWADRYPEIDPRFLFPTLGYNLRPIEIQAELGLRQLKHLARWHRRRSEIAAVYQEAVGPEFIPYQITPRSTHSWFAFPLVLREGGTDARKKLTHAFRIADIPTRPIVGGNLAAHPFMERFGIRNTDPLDNARHVQRHGLYLPISQLFSDSQVNLIADAIRHWR